MDWERARYLMVEQQIRPWNVTDQKVLQRFLDVKREDFVPADKRELAFADIELPIGDGACMLAPKIEARFLQEADIKPTDRVLVVGATSGYLVALAAGLAQKVCGVESRADLVAAANASLKAVGVKNAEVVQGDVLAGLSAQAPFDVILVCGSACEVSGVYEDQLATGGRLIIVLGHAPIMTAVRLTRLLDNAFESEKVFEYSLPRLQQEECVFAF